MNKFAKSLFLFCVFITTTTPGFSEEDAVETHSTEYEPTQINVEEADADAVLTENKRDEMIGRHIGDDVDTRENLENHSKPLRSIFLGIYKNYKSTYLGNKTLTEYKQTLRENLKNKNQQQQQRDENEADVEDIEHDGIVTTYPANEETENVETTTIVSQSSSIKLETKTKLSPNKKRKSYAPQTKNSLHQYNVGPALNLSLDMNNSIVKVNLDGESLKELVTGRWLNDNTEDGRGKKYEMVTRILPLFILPFLIQSAIVPFLVTKLKLLLMKSILVGKLAIFLLIISAFRNSNKQMQTYEVAPSYWAGEPSRRSELAAAASNMAYNGYRVEGKPAAWVN